MIKIKNYGNIRGEQLRAELANAGIKISDVTPYISNEELYIDVIEGDESLVADIVANHQPIAPPAPSISEKLSLVGVSLDELKEALGLA